MHIIRILIVEDDKDWLEAIASFLHKESDFEVVGQAMSREEAEEILKYKQVDVILLDINLNGNRIDGIEAICEFRKYTNADIIMVTSIEDKDIVLDSIEAGAVNYVLKGEFLILPNAIRQIKRNKSPIQMLSQEYVSLKQESQLLSLTVSERAIFNLIINGHSRNQIEIELNKSTNTVRNQINSLLRKLGVKNCREVLKKYQSKKR